MLRIARLVPLCLLPFIAFAQEAGTAKGPEPTLRISTHLVYVDVLVRDSDGKVVKGLAQQDFKVIEDGHPQSVEFFDAHGMEPAGTSAQVETGSRGCFPLLRELLLASASARIVPSSRQ
jgi:hypothetical protein